MGVRSRARNSVGRVDGHCLNFTAAWPVMGENSYAAATRGRLRCRAAVYDEIRPDDGRRVRGGEIEHGRRHLRRRRHPAER